MKKIIRRVIDCQGIIQIEEIPCPRPGRREILVKNGFSLISTGTEMGTLGRTPAALTKEIMDDPWRRKAVQEIIFGQGPWEAMQRIMDELYFPRNVGYSCAGTVVQCGDLVLGVKPGDFVACAGQGHAEYICVPATMFSPVPDGLAPGTTGLGLDEAAFGTLGAIALQSIRRAELEIGEKVVVIGLGLVGLLTAQLAAAAGAYVIGLDYQESRLALARQLGIPEVINAAADTVASQIGSITANLGADCVFMCAVANSSAPVNLAMTISGFNGRVIIVGRTPLDLERQPFLSNELDLRFSRAYGPGLYHASYEQHGYDIPRELVPWTASRNIRAFLELVQQKKVSVKPLVDRRYNFEDAQAAYQQLQTGLGAGVALLLEYNPGDSGQKPSETVSVSSPAKGLSGNKMIGLIGAGRFVRNFRIPALRQAGFTIAAVASKTGTTAAFVAKKYKAAYATSDSEKILADPQIPSVLVATRHDAHPDIVCRALELNKTVFVEKPLSLDREGLNRVVATASRTGNNRVIIGYNRRHNPLVQKVKSLLAGRSGPIVVEGVFNLPAIPKDHWTLDAIEGGGRLVAECDHFFDLFNFLVNDTPVSVTASIFDRESRPLRLSTKFQVRITYRNGSIANLVYCDNGPGKFPRETFRVIGDALIVELSDFQKLSVYKGTNSKTYRKWQKDMGFAAESEKWLLAAAGTATDAGGLADAVKSLSIAYAAIESIGSGAAVSIT